MTVNWLGSKLLKKDQGKHVVELKYDISICKDLLFNAGCNRDYPIGIVNPSAANVLFVHDDRY
jgi:hypothetical protein